MERFRCLTGLLALLVVSACATYTPAPIEPDRGAAAIEARRLTDPDLAQFIAALRPIAPGTPSARWDLTGLTVSAFYLHPNLSLARAQAETAEAAIATAASRANPTLGIIPTKHTNIVNPSSWTIGLVAEFVLDLGGRRAFREAASRDLADAARAGVAAAAWATRQSVRTALLDLWAIERRAALHQRRVALQRDLVGLLERRLASGDISAIEVARERQILAQANAAIAEDQRNAGLARVVLAGSLGLSAQGLNGVTLSLAAFDAPPPPSVAKDGGAARRLAVTGRADLQGLLAEYRAAENSLRTELAQQIPDLVLGPGYSFDQGDNLYSLGLSAALPVFNRNEGPIAEADAKRREVAARFAALQTAIIGSTDRALVGYAAADQAVAEAEALVAAEQTRFNRISAQYRAGAIDRAAVLAGELELVAADLNAAEATIRQRNALGTLEDAAQTPLFDPEAAPLFARALTAPPSGEKRP